MPLKKQLGLFVKDNLVGIPSLRKALHLISLVDVIVWSPNGLIESGSSSNIVLDVHVELTQDVPAFISM